MKLEGKVAIVTAAGRGLGRGIALAIAGEGADVVVNSYRKETTEAVADEIKAMGRRCLAIPADITRPEKILQVVEETINTFGRIDILVNNVGSGSRTPKEPDSGPLGEIAALWDTMYEQNLRATVLMCEAVAPHFIEKGGGKIVNIGSIAGRSNASLIPVLENIAPPSYHSMKAGISSYTQTLAERLGPYNVNVNCVCPGIVYTEPWQRNSKRMVSTISEFKGQDSREWFLGISQGKHPHWFRPTPMKREQTVEDIGRAVVFLISEESQNITGQALNVDGGMIKS